MTSSPTSPEHQAYLTLVRSSQQLTQQTVDLLKEHGLSGPQFNVLRILRGAEPVGATCGEVIQKLMDINRDPDVTRLLDNLEKQDLISRARSTADRRVVVSRINAKGLELLSRIDQPMLELHKRQFTQLGEEKSRLLVELLKELVPQP